MLLQKILSSFEVLTVESGRKMERQMGILRVKTWKAAREGEEATEV